MPGENGDSFVDEIDIKFKWVPGMASSQKKKNVTSLHQAALIKGFSPVLEISTKSQIALGEELSAFNLQIKLPGMKPMSVEVAFQGSKVFQNGGPYHEFYSMTAREVRHDERLRNSGQLTGFNINGDEWGLIPRTGFYDWLYLTALEQNPSMSIHLLDFHGFTDIEFNPEKSINCQARSAALYVSLSRNHLLDKAMQNKSSFIEIIQSGLSNYTNSKNSAVQPTLF